MSVEALAAPLRVVIADDHAFYRHGLAAALISAGIEVVGQAADGHEAIVVAEATRPDVAVLDVAMPRTSGIEAVRWLLERAPRTRAVVVSAAAEVDTVVEAVQAGAVGFILKEDPLEEMVAGVRAVGGGAAFLSPQVTSLLLNLVRHDRSGRSSAAAGLSPRQLEILRLVALGKGNDEIAGALFLSTRTVKNHVSTMMTKLEVDNRVQAAVWAAQHGLV